VGLNEAIETLCGKSLYEDNKALDLAEQTVKYIHASVKRSVRKPESRPVAAIVPSEKAAARLAQLDIERYGWAKVHVKGTKEQPLYTDLVTLPAGTKISLDARLKIEEKMQQLTLGGHLTVIRIDEDEPDPDKLLTLTKRLTSESKIGLYTFSRSFAYCGHCGKTVSGQPAKCPVCGSVDNLVGYTRASAKYAPETTQT
jgi:anaerobic ribonucleoside-triphosphate reductase